MKFPRSLALLVLTTGVFTGCGSEKPEAFRDLIRVDDPVAEQFFSVSGKIDLGEIGKDYFGDPTQFTAHFELRYPGSLQPVYIAELKLGPNGEYTLPTLPAGKWVMLAKSATRPPETTEVEISKNLDDVNFTLKPGDINGDGHINVKDLDILTAVFDSAVPADERPEADATDRARADVNDDGSVDVRDLDLLIRYFDTI